MPLLTKSKYVIGLQCQKYLWMMFNDLDKIPEKDMATEYIIQQGNIVGQLAKKLFPKGIDIPEDFKKNLKITKDALKKRKILFEAGIMSEDLYARGDILVPVNKNSWDIIEVKGSTKVKDNHIHDVSFQKYVYEKAGLKIRKCFLLHLNSDFLKKGKVIPKKIFTNEEITAEVDEVIVGIQERIDEMMEIIDQPEAPTIAGGAYCEGVKHCLSQDCWSFLPEGHVFELYRGGKKSFELLNAEVFCIKDIPQEFKLNIKQEIQRKCANTGKVHLDKQGIKKFLKQLKSPLYYLDFETFSSAVPLYEGTKPYQQIPFQFSLHIADGKKVKHIEFLHDSKDDPREKFLLELKKALDKKGNIIVFNQSFEKTILKQLAEAFPKHRKWVNSVDKRIVDLLVPFRNFDYYNPEQKGSCSIKAVLPAVTGENYKDLNIDNGSLASVSYFETVFGGLKKQEVTKIRADLLKYCSLDTEGMIWIVDQLKKLSRS